MRVACSLRRRKRKAGAVRNKADNDRFLEWKLFKLWWKKTQEGTLVIEGEFEGDLRYVPAPQADDDDEDSTDDEGPLSTNGSEDNMPSLESRKNEELLSFRKRREFVER